MFYIIELVGQQFKFAQGEQKMVPRLEGKEGEKITTGRLILSFSDSKVTLPSTKQSVTLKIEKHLKGKKVIAFKKKRRKGFQKKIGHRTQYTQVRFEAVN